MRLGVFPSAGPALLPRVLVALRRTRPDLVVTSRVGTTPSLARALRAGALDVALLTSQPPHRPVDDESPPLRLRTVSEGPLLVAVPAAGPLGDRDTLDPAELVDQPWIVTPSRSGEPQLGVWPSLPGRARVVHTGHDWATKLALVAAGCGVTTVPSVLAPALPAGVRALPVASGPAEIRRLVVATLPDADPARCATSSTSSTPSPPGPRPEPGLSPRCSASRPRAPS